MINVIIYNIDICFFKLGIFSPTQLGVVTMHKPFRIFKIKKRKQDTKNCTKINEQQVNQHIFIKKKIEADIDIESIAEVIE